MVKKDHKDHFVCSSCDVTFNKWHGKCPECSSWNSISERSGSKLDEYYGYAGEDNESLQFLDQIAVSTAARISTSYKEFDRVVGGGLVPSSVILLAGHPGAGKSTLLLQIVASISLQHNVIYVTGEESASQIAIRSSRLVLDTTNLAILTTTRLENICKVIITHKPKILIVDSIQVIYKSQLSGAPGGVNQIKECAITLAKLAKQCGVILFLIGHVTKDNAIAGPRILEHCVDVSIMLESLQDKRFIAIRSIKNRFGATNELGILAMTSRGLKEVGNPSAIFLSSATSKTPGTTVTVTWEGSRCLLVELQALVVPSFSEYPKRLCVGWDSNRLSMLLAVLQRHHGINLSKYDIFVNMVGGIKIGYTSADLPVILALVSSFQDRALPEKMISFGEIGLTGEIRPVTNGLARLKEARNHSFNQAMVSVSNATKSLDSLNVIGVSNISQSLNHYFR